MSTDAYVVIEHLRGEVADISYVMLAAAREFAKSSDGKVIALLLGHKAQELAKDLAADEVLYVDMPELQEFAPEPYQEVLKGLVAERQPRAVLLGNTSIGSDVAGALSIDLNLPVVSSCLELTADGKFTSQICGGKILAEGDLPAPSAIVTMIPGRHKAEAGKSGAPPPVVEVEGTKIGQQRATLLQYVEPVTDDVDIAKEGILVSVGRGIQNKDNLELFEDLAAALGGVVTGSRPVVDQGWLASSRLVGKSGKHVKPKMYLAVGISGAPEHVEAIADSEAIVAVNMDPAAPIFDLAKYGVEIDMFDLVEVLTTKVKEAKAA
jgi:electron transfer flavoprotein alpha subunit